MKRQLLGLFVTAFCVTAAHAHHSTSAVYNRDGAIIEAEGVITNVAWVNPHVRFEMRGKGADGVERLWKIDTTLPFMRDALDVEDDLMYRRALHTFAVDARRGAQVG